MQNKFKWFAICIVGIIAILLSSRFSFTHVEKSVPLGKLSNTHIHEKLLNHTREFSAEIIKVTKGVFAAVGYAIANSIIVECNNSLVIIDTTESVKVATQIRNDLFTLYPHLQHKKVKHVVYTHYHPDHTFGTKGWIDDIDNPPIIISHPKTVRELERILSISSTATHFRAQRQFGTVLKELHDKVTTKSTHYELSHKEKVFASSIHDCSDDSHENASIMDEDEQLKIEQIFQNNSGVFVNCGIGPFFAYGDPLDRFMFYPTLTLNRSEETLDLDGVEFKFYHAPGETVDQIFVYLPSKRVLLPADNIYRAFPNLYAIRGSPTRPVREWIRSLDAMRRLSPRPKYLVPQHTRPVYGEEAIYDLLTDYRDGIAFVHDQTVRFMNLGFSPDDIVPIVRQYMPRRLLEHPFLQEFYGTIDWSVRGIFEGYLGWFSGDPVDLYPLHKHQQALRLAKMVKSPSVMLATAEQNLLNHRSRDDCQWSLQLSDAVLSLSSKAHLSRKEELLSAITMKEIYDIDKGQFVTVSTDPSLQVSKKEYKKALEIKIKALQCLAEHMISANGRNYYLSSAYELITQQEPVFATQEDREWVSFAVPLEQVFQMLTVRYKVEEMKDFNTSLCFHFPDIQEFFLCLIRDGVVEILHDHYGTNDKTRLEENCFKAAVGVTEIASKDFRALIAADVVKAALMYTQNKIKVVKGSVKDFVKFRGFFETQ